MDIFTRKQDLEEAGGPGNMAEETSQRAAGSGGHWQDPGAGSQQVVGAAGALHWSRAVEASSPAAVLSDARATAEAHVGTGEGTTCGEEHLLSHPPSKALVLTVTLPIILPLQGVPAHVL
ncbi:hypothetical protein P7K49_013395 [Saguinus oedipus]|uniref:Uncharacterized protein n=1 Tax=Saguinus oedipus TaxID=9490 RepID=A0ABQ9VFS0_SAGOE|nr:hypothetical protein P7K49_013395 [Saguinus oedipus]